MSSLVSIIVPVYNGEAFIGECLNSLLSQTHSNWEAVCVDDGSTDNTLAILNEYAKKDERFKVISQKNAGTAKARETAIKNAKGDFIAYVDGDDFVADSYIEKMLKALSEKAVDVVYCFYYNFCDGKIVKKHKKKMKIYKNAKKEKLQYLTGPQKLAKRSLFDDIEFAESCCYGEDSSISMQLAIKGAKSFVVEDYLYFYRVHASSTVNKKNSFFKNLRQLVNGYEAVDKFMIKRGVKEANKVFVFKKMIKVVCALINGEIR